MRARYVEGLHFGNKSSASGLYFLAKPPRARHGPGVGRARGAPCAPWALPRRVRTCLARARLDLDTGPLFDRTHDAGDIGISPLARLGDRQELAHRVADHHRNSQPLALFE